MHMTSPEQTHKETIFAYHDIISVTAEPICAY